MRNLGRLECFKHLLVAFNSPVDAALGIRVYRQFYFRHGQSRRIFKRGMQTYPVTLVGQNFNRAVETQLARAQIINLIRQSLSIDALGQQLCRCLLRPKKGMGAVIHNRGTNCRLLASVAGIIAALDHT